MDCFVSENLTIAFRQTSRGGVSFHETLGVGVGGGGVGVTSWNLKGMFGWGENRRMENKKRKIWWKNDIFHYLVQERKQEKQKIGRKIIPPCPHFFILPIWEENGEEKVLNDLHKYPHFIHLTYPSHFPITPVT